ncbi:MAG: hypothetical protein NC114_06240 [Ruminococcus flavefaciens]|nr:hypothetical protein [Ruminococcus flavefaciens]
MKTLVSSHTVQGVLLDITVRVSEDEAPIYQSLIDSDRPKCPACGAAMKLKAEDMHLVIHSPLTPLFGMDIGTPRFKCPSCGTDVEIPADMDLHAFPSILQYVTRLRQEYKRRVALAQAKSKGIVIDGKK